MAYLSLSRLAALKNHILIGWKKVFVSIFAFLRMDASYSVVLNCRFFFWVSTTHLLFCQIFDTSVATIILTRNSQRAVFWIMLHQVMISKILIWLLWKMCFWYNGRCSLFQPWSCGLKSCYWLKRRKIMELQREPKTIYLCSTSLAWTSSAKSQS